METVEQQRINASKEIEIIIGASFNLSESIGKINWIIHRHCRVKRDCRSWYEASRNILEYVSLMIVKLGSSLYQKQRCEVTANRTVLKLTDDLGH